MTKDEAKLILARGAPTSDMELALQTLYPDLVIARKSDGGIVIPSAGNDVPLALRMQGLGCVASRCALMTSFNSTNKQIMSQSRHFARDNITSFRAVFQNWYINVAGTGAETGTGADATITASVEYPTGVITQILFGGSPVGTIKDMMNLYSDETFIQIPIGAPYLLKTRFENPNGIIYNGKGVNASGYDRGEYGVSGIADKTMGGTINATAGGVFYGPSAIIAKTSKPSVFLLGDSRVNGQGDTTDFAMDTGVFARSVGRDFAYMNCGQPSDRAQWFLASNARRLELSQYFTHVLCEYGRNDIYIGSRTLAQVQADVKAIAALFPNKPVFWGTLSPDTTSTDSWATTGNQTAKAQENTRTQFNDWLRLGGIPGLAGYVEIADQLETARNSGIWKAPGFTADGIHESQTACLAIRDSGAIQGWRFAF